MGGFHVSMSLVVELKQIKDFQERLSIYFNNEQPNLQIKDCKSGSGLRGIGAQ